MSAAGALELALRGSAVESSGRSFELPGRSSTPPASKSSIATAPRQGVARRAAAAASMSVAGAKRIAWIRACALVWMSR
jgi:hypothetical protein